MSNTTNIIVHNTSTEVLIIISQTVFFVLLFLLLKNGLVDRRGMLSSKERINEEMFQIMAIFFAIFVIIALFMIPIESYEYAHFVVPITFSIMLMIVIWELYVVLYSDSPVVTKTRFPDLENSDKKTTPNTNPDTKPKSREDGSSKFWTKPFRSGTTGSVGATKRPVNF